MIKKANSNLYKEQRVGVFVDVQNMYYSARNIYKAKVNFKTILKEAVRGRQLLSSKHSPLIEESDRETSKLLAVVRSSIYGIQEPDVSLSIYLINQSSKQKV